MGNDEGPAGGFPAPVCPHLGRTGLLTHIIREIEAKQRRGGSPLPVWGECTDTHITAPPSRLAPPRPACYSSRSSMPVGAKQIPLAKVGSVGVISLGSETPTNIGGYRQISAMTRKKPGGPKIPHPASGLRQSLCWGCASPSPHLANPRLSQPAQRVPPLGHPSQWPRPN